MVHTPVRDRTYAPSCAVNPLTANICASFDIPDQAGEYKFSVDVPEGTINTWEILWTVQDADSPSKKEYYGI